jgi:hypothetical protein
MDQFELLLRESVDDMVINLILEDDDVSWSLMDTFQPVDRAGRDTHNALGSGAAGWFAEWRIRVQRGGLVTGGTFSGNTPEVMGADDTLYTGQAADALYPDAAKAPMRSWEAIRLALKRIQGVHAINRTQILADMATQPLEDVASGAVEDVVAQVRSLITAYLYGAGTASIAQVDVAAGVTLTEGANTAVTIDGGTAYRFVVGQRYVGGTNADPRVTSAGTAADPAVFRCVDIDTDTRQPLFEPEPGVGNITLADNTHIMVAGTYDFTAASVALGTRAANGFESLLISSGNFPGALKAATASHRHLRSYVKGDEANLVPPTPEIVAELIDKITDSGKRPPSVLLAEQSLWTLYSQLERQAGATYPVPQGGAFTASGGVAGPRVTHGEVTFSRLASPRVRPGCIIGISPETFKRFMPLGNKTIKWALAGGGVAGAQSIYGPIRSGRQLSELSDAPFDVFVEFGCTDPRRNFRRIGLYSQRTMGGT